jgi:biopolymer transport protein ExbD
MPVPAPHRLPDTADLTLAPIVDVLLAVFLVLLVAQALGRTALGFGPPTADLAGPDRQVLLAATPAGLTLNGQPVPDAVLDTRLAEAFAGRRVRVLFLEPASGASAAAVARLAERARAAGVATVAIVPPAR